MLGAGQGVIIRVGCTRARAARQAGSVRPRSRRGPGWARRQR